MNYDTTLDHDDNCPLSHIPSLIASCGCHLNRMAQYTTPWPHEAVVLGVTHSPSFDPALDTAQASAYTGLSAAFLEKLRCIGGGPKFIKYGRRAVRYRKADVDAWMNERLCS